uniref:Putative GPCR n=1 Tax=Philodina roseola TaxID=96448 RepID=B2ZFC5_PHIRO|nr:putative GPCR [Philodina roseola]
MNSTDNSTILFDNETFFDSIMLANPCPRQRHITRPILTVHNYALFCFGSVLNFMAFIVLMQRSLRCHSTFAYLAFLSFTNGLLSLVHFSKWMFKYYFNVLFESYLISCRFHRFSSDFLTHFSLYTLIFVNIDRARAVTRNRPSMKYPKSKFHTVFMRELVVAAILCVFHFHWIIKYGYEGMCLLLRCLFSTKKITRNSSQCQCRKYGPN